MDIKQEARECAVALSVALKSRIQLDDFLMRASRLSEGGLSHLRDLILGHSSTPRCEDLNKWCAEVETAQALAGNPITEKEL